MWVKSPNSDRNFLPVEAKQRLGPKSIWVRSFETQKLRTQIAFRPPESEGTMMITLFTTIICNTLDDELDLHSLSSSSEREVKITITSSVTLMGDCAGCSGGGARRAGVYRNYWWISNTLLFLADNSKELVFFILVQSSRRNDTCTKPTIENHYFCLRFIVPMQKSIS